MLLAFTLVIVVVAASEQGVLNDGGAEMKPPTKRQSFSPMQCSSSNGKYSYNKNAYNGPYNWSKLSMCCGGRWQSPVNLRSSRARCGRPYRFYHSMFPAVSRVPGKLYNSGHSPKLEFASRPKVTLSGVPYSMQSDYILSELHFHVGNIRGSGSEHRIDGRGYDGELHIIHYKAEYGSVEAASMRPDGLAVIGVLLQQSRFSPNKELNRLVYDISRLGSTIGQKMDVSLDPRRLVPSDGKFFTYQGSLTTPPCSESVRWIVMTKPIPTTAENLRVLRMLPTDEGVATAIHTNVRPPLPLGERRLDANFFCYG